MDFKSVSFTFLAGIYLFKVNKRNTKKRCAICSKLTIKTPESCHSGVFIANFEHVLHLVLVFLLLTLSRLMPGNELKRYVIHEFTQTFSSISDQQLFLLKIKIT